MRGTEILKMLGEIKPEYIQKAKEAKRGEGHRWTYLWSCVGVGAAILCIGMIGAMVLHNFRSNSPENDSSSTGGMENIEKTVLTWMLPNGADTGDSEVYRKFNRLLEKKGYSFQVEFCTYHEVDFDEYIELLYQKKESGAGIDLFNTGFDYYGGLYGDLIADEMCLSLNTYLESESGQPLYTSKAEGAWKSLSKDGNIYGVDDSFHVVRSGEYLYINREIAQKYDVDMERMITDRSYFWEMMEKVEIGEDENKAFVPYLTDDSMEFPAGTYPFVGPIGLIHQGDQIKAVNLYEQPENRTEFLNRKRMRRSASLSANLYKEKLKDGNYFIYPSLFEIDIPNAEVYQTKVPMAANQSGAINCIASWSEHPKEAFELLQAIHTDRELCELLAYGIEGVHYTVEENKICKTDVVYKGDFFAAHYFGNRSLLRPVNDGSDRGTGKQPEPEGEEPLLGTRLDLRSCKEKLMELKHITAVYFDIENYLWDDWDAKYDEGIAALKEAGIDEVLDEMNRQLREKGLQ